jgi:hypothetical protein
VEEDPVSPLDPMQQRRVIPGPEQNTGWALSKSCNRNAVDLSNIEMQEEKRSISMKNLRNITLVVLLTLVGLLTLPMWQHSGAITYAQQGQSDAKCVNLPAQANDHAHAATSGNPKFCTPTPSETPTPDPTSEPTDTPTETPTDAPTPVPPANITVYNTGGFFVQYYVSYSLPGLPLQSLYSGVFNVNQGVTLTIPGTATNVGVLIQVYTGITGWQTACTRSYAQAIDAVIIVSGTTFLPTCAG